MPAKDLWDTVQKLAPLSPVRYEFRLHGWQGAPWHVLRVELIEELNRPYHLTLELVIAEPRMDLDELLGDDCTFEVDRDGHDARTVHGLVLAADDLGRVADRHHIRLEVGPALTLLAQTVDTRAWQDSTAVDVLRLVLASALARDNRHVKLEALRSGDYPRRDYCVQFRESDLAFAARLMEEEGITYYFDHDSPQERLVLVDDNSDFPALQPGPLEILETEPDTAPRESIQRFTWGRRLRSTAVDQRNFDWTSPDAPQAARRPGADLRGRTREVYEHDDIVYPGDGPRHARIKQERLGRTGHVASGTSNVTRLLPGVWFALLGHSRSELDDKYLVTRVIHRGHSPDAAIFQQQSSGPRYGNEFECIPLKEQHRPPLTHQKPKVSGLQTAIVTGPPGEEVHCDEHGRIKVLPHWDRISPKDDTSSVWIRVAQSVAGGGWGMFALPRIGQEVVVDFLDGDPDRPLVVGCVYNGTNTPPYPLPAEKTKTTIKSNSSPGGGGSNELRFEDQAGAEEVYLHAQKDWNSVVENNRSLSIGANETNSVGANRTRTVGMNETITVGMNDTLTVGMNDTITVGMNITQTCGLNLTRIVGANETVEIVKNQNESIGGNQVLAVQGNRTKSISGAESVDIGGSRSHSVATSEKILIGASQSISVGGDQAYSVGDNQTTAIAKNHALTVALASAETIGLGKVLTVGLGYQETVGVERKTTVGQGYSETVGTIRSIVAGGSIELTCGAAKLVLEKGGKVTLSGTSFEFTASGPVKINGTVIDLN
jgi:type VI secretion system secreted protein VgrG